MIHKLLQLCIDAAVVLATVFLALGLTFANAGWDDNDEWAFEICGAWNPKDAATRKCYGKVHKQDWRKRCAAKDRPATACEHMEQQARESERQDRIMKACEAKFPRSYRDGRIINGDEWAKCFWEEGRQHHPGVVSLCKSMGGRLVGDDCITEHTPKQILGACEKDEVAATLPWQDCIKRHPDYRKHRAALDRHMQKAFDERQGAKAAFNACENARDNDDCRRRYSALSDDDKATCLNPEERPYICERWLEPCHANVGKDRPEHCRRQGR